jgi:hypothetical protein
MSVPNMLPGTFEISVPNTQNIRILDTPIDPNWSQPNQQYKEYNLYSQSNSNKNYAYSMLKGIQQVSIFSLLYFSNENIQEIQKLIKYNVYTIGNHRIDNQNVDELLVIMRAVYLEYSKIPANKKDYTQELAKLNEIVTERSIRIILSAISQQKKYLYDINNYNVMDSQYGINNDNVRNKDIRDISSVIFGNTSNLI